MYKLILQLSSRIFPQALETILTGNRRTLFKLTIEAHQLLVKIILIKQTCIK